MPKRKQRHRAGPPSFAQVQAARQLAYARVMRTTSRVIPGNPAEERRCSEAFAAELRRRGWLAEEGRAA